MVTRKKTTRAGTGRTIATGTAAQENGWNGATRFQAISGVFGKILELQQAVAEDYAPAAEAFALSQSGRRLQASRLARSRRG